MSVLQSLYRHPNLSSSMQSIISRVIISSLISLPKMPSSSLSQDPNFIKKLNAKVQEFSLTIGCGTTNVMSKTLPFLIDAVFANDRPEVHCHFFALVYLIPNYPFSVATKHRDTSTPSRATSCTIDATY